MNVKDKKVIERIIKYCLDIDFLMKRYQSDFHAYKTDISFQSSSPFFSSFNVRPEALYSPVEAV